MITYKQLLERLKEPTNIKAAEDIVGKDVINANKGERTTHELETPPHSETEAHLKAHGFDTEKLSSGKVKDKHGREVGAGRALSVSKAPKELMEKFAKHQQGSKQATENQHIVTSTKPKDVAGMTSETPWAGTSCMNLTKGCNSKYVKSDVKHKTRVHFLTHKEDKDIEHPITRSLSKKFVGKLPSGEEHHVYRRDIKTYGKSNSAFEHTIDKHNEKETPMHPDVKEYKLHHELLDNGRTTYENPDWYKKHMNDPILSKSEIDNAVQHPDKEIALAALKHPDADEETTEYAAQHPDKEVALAALKHFKADKGTTEYAVYHPDKEVALAALKHPKVDTVTTRYAVSHPDKEVALAALNHHKADEETIARAALHPDKEVALAALHHNKAVTVTTRYAAKHPDKEVALAALRHPEAATATTRHAAEHPNKEVALAALKHPKVDTVTTRYAVHHPDKEVALAALNHHKADEETIARAAQHPDKEVALAALRHPNSSPYTTHSGVKHPDKEVALAALHHKLADRGTREEAAKHPDKEVRDTAEHWFKTK